MIIRRKWLFIWKSFRYIMGYLKAPLFWFLVADGVGSRPLLIGRVPHVRNEGTMRVGRRFRVRSLTYRSSFSTGPDGLLEIGNDVSINQGVVIHAACHIKVGSRVSIGDRVRIYDTNFHPTVPGSETKTGAVSIGDDCWIGTGATILPQVRIGRGAVVGSGAVVTKDIPEGSLFVPQQGAIVKSFPIPKDFRRRGETRIVDIPKLF